MTVDCLAEAIERTRLLAGVLAKDLADRGAIGHRDWNNIERMISAATPEDDADFSERLMGGLRRANDAFPKLFADRLAEFRPGLVCSLREQFGSTGGESREPTRSDVAPAFYVHPLLSRFLKLGETGRPAASLGHALSVLQRRLTDRFGECRRLADRDQIVHHLVSDACGVYVYEVLAFGGPMLIVLTGETAREGVGEALVDLLDRVVGDLAGELNVTQLSKDEFQQYWDSHQMLAYDIDGQRRVSWN